MPPPPECGAMSQGYIGYHLGSRASVMMHKTLGAGTPRHRRHLPHRVRSRLRSRVQEPDQADRPFSHREEQAKEFGGRHPSKVFVEDPAAAGVASSPPDPATASSRLTPSLITCPTTSSSSSPAVAAASPVVRDYENKGCYAAFPPSHRQGPGRRAGRGSRRRRPVPADRRRACRHQLRQAQPGGARGPHRRRGRAPGRRGPVRQGFHGAQGPRCHQVRPLPRRLHLHHRRSDKAAETMVGLSGTRIHE